MRAVPTPYPNPAFKTHGQINTRHSSETLILAPSLFITVLRRYSSTNSVHHFLSFCRESKQLTSCRPRIIRPGHPHGRGIPEHVEHGGILGYSDSPGLARDISGDRGRGRKALGGRGVKRCPQSTNSLQLRLQRINKSAEILPRRSIRRIAIFTYSAANAVEVTLCSMQPRPKSQHRELVGFDLLSLALLSFAPSQVKCNKSSCQCGCGTKPAPDRGNGRPISVASPLETKTWNNHMRQVHTGSLSLTYLDSATDAWERRKGA